MESLARLLVQQPDNILLCGIANAAAWALLRISIYSNAPRYNLFWVPAILWMAYAIWEWLVLQLSPEADIRVDLMLIWPTIALTTLWSLFKFFVGLRAWQSKQM